MVAYQGKLVSLTVSDSSPASLLPLAAFVLLLKHPRNAWGPRAGQNIVPVRWRLRWLWGHMSLRDIQYKTRATMQQGYRGPGVQKSKIRTIAPERTEVVDLSKQWNRGGTLPWRKESITTMRRKESEANIQRISSRASRMHSPMERPLFKRFVWVS